MFQRRPNRPAVQPFNHPFFVFSRYSKTLSHSFLSTQPNLIVQGPYSYLRPIRRLLKYHLTAFLFQPGNNNTTPNLILVLLSLSPLLLPKPSPCRCVPTNLVSLRTTSTLLVTTYFLSLLIQLFYLLHKDHNDFIIFQVSLSSLELTT